VNLVDPRHDPTRRVSQPQPQPQPPWPLAQRIAFRFGFAYFFIFLFPFPLGLIPWLSGAMDAYGKLWTALVDAAAAHVLHLGHPLSWEGNGSGDTTADYVTVLVQVAVAVGVTLVWSVLDRRRRDYRRLFAWLHLYLRWELVIAMLSYGSFKVIKTQFPLPGPERLLEPYGESSPMGLLWTFMGQSTGYTIFAGTLEVLGGVLLVFRRTATLGALVVAAVMTNVVMLNFCYDVPVKIYSSHLLLMAMILAAPELRRLFRALVLQQGVPPTVPRGPIFARRWQRVGAALLALAIVGRTGYKVIDKGLERYAEGDGAALPAYYGVWEVESFVRNGETLPPLTTDAQRWQRVTLNRYGTLGIRRMNGARARYDAKLDPARHTFTLTTSAPLAVAGAELEVTELADDQLELTGQIDDALVTVRLRRQAASKQLLVTRGFHWVNEYPFNR
jgi:uncharacterized membrane protein YphA (DoxX/SURF4 family)